MNASKKVCIVTGAANGIGKECAITLAKKGIDVVAADLQEDGLKNTIETIVKSGGTAECYVGDMTEESSIVKLVEFTIGRFGKIDMLSSNVAATSGEYTAQDMRLDFSLDYLMNTFKINVGGSFLLAKHCIADMCKHGGGSIVLMSSVSARLAAAGHILYGMTKAALEQLVRGIAGAYGKQGIRANAVEPSMTITPALQDTIPATTLEALQLGILTPEFTDGSGIADVVAFLLSDDARTIQGSTIFADNGYSILPGAVIASSYAEAIVGSLK